MCTGHTPPEVEIPDEKNKDNENEDWVKVSSIHNDISESCSTKTRSDRVQSKGDLDETEERAVQGKQER